MPLPVIIWEVSGILDLHSDANRGCQEFCTRKSNGIVTWTILASEQLDGHSVVSVSRLRQSSTFAKRDDKSIDSQLRNLPSAFSNHTDDLLALEEIYRLSQESTVDARLLRDFLKGLPATRDTTKNIQASPHKASSDQTQGFVVACVKLPLLQGGPLCIGKNG